MTYSSDKPIHKISEDLLGRAPFSFELAKAIYNYKENSGLVIGIYGSWGTGKTSIINMIENEISNFEDDKTIFIRFSPWNYSDKDSLIRLFFESLKIKLNIHHNKNIDNAIDNYLEALDILTLIPGVNYTIVGIIKKIIKAFRKKNETFDLEANKKLLEKQLSAINKKIIVVIDDLDRLTNIQIRETFQLVKQVADFPNLIYILSMDREVVARALTEVQNIDGNEYLEKIVQIPFEIPKIGKDKLQNILNNKIEKIIDSSSDKIEININYWSKIYFKCIEPYINTIRDVNRVINTFQFRFPVLKQEICFEDLFAITVLEVLDPKLYKWIRENKRVLLGMLTIERYFTDDVDYNKEVIKKEFKSKGIYEERAIIILSILFPEFKKRINKYDFNYESNENIRLRMGIAHEQKFDLYFKFNLEDIKITRDTIRNCIYNFNYSELHKTINDISFNGDIIYFIEEIRCFIEEIPYERISLIAKTLIELTGFFDGYKTKMLFKSNAWDESVDLIFHILNKLKTKKEIYQIFISSIEQINIYGLGIIANMLNSVDVAYFNDNYENQKYKVLEKENLEECKIKLLNKIKKAMGTNHFWKIYSFYSIISLWESIDKVELEFSLKNLFSQDKNKLKFVCSIGNCWSGSKGIRWEFNESLYSKYFSKDEIYKIIDELKKEEFSLFSDLEQIKLASFYANYNTNNMEQYNEEISWEIYNNRNKNN